MLVREAALSVRQGPPVEDAASWAQDVAERDNAHPGRWSAALGSKLPLSAYWARVLARYSAGSVVVQHTGGGDAAMERLLKALEMLGIQEREKIDPGGGHRKDESDTTC